jgi:hypothetical protein
MFSRGVQRFSSRVLGRATRRYGSDHSAVAHGKDAHHAHGEVAAQSHKQEVKELEGWLFGEKYMNLNPNKALYEQIPENAQYLWGVKPGTGRKEGWETTVYTMLGLLTGTAVIGFWARPDTRLTTWGAEEARERNYLKQQQK